MKTRWYKYLTVLFVFLFIFPLNSKAECDYKRMAELNKIASNVQVVYNYDVGQDSIPRFKLNLSNVTSDIYVEDNYGNIYETNVENIPLYVNQTYSFTIFSKDGACFGEKIITKHLETPYFNSYIFLPECANNTSDKCQIWFDSSGLNSEDYEIVQPNEKNSGTKKKQTKGNLLLGKLPLLGILTIIIVGGIVFIVRKRKR